MTLGHRREFTPFPDGPVFAQITRSDGISGDQRGAMRKLIRLLVLGLPLAVAYAAWPVYSALEIRDAIVAGDTATLERKVDWEALRVSIKASITPDTLSRLMADPDAPKPTLWQRVKAAVAPSMADGLIARYVTPQHLPILLGYRRVYRGSIKPVLGLEEPPTVLAGTSLAGSGLDRLASFWTRVRRAVFESPRRFVLEVEDKYRPGRRYVGTFELKDWEWKLTGLAVTGGGF